MVSTTLSNMPSLACGCPACVSAAKDALTSLDFIGSATATRTEANTLDTGYRWGSGTTGITLTYKFYSALPSYYTGADSESNGFTVFNSQMQAATVRILTQIESFANIDFVSSTATNTNLGFASANLGSSVGAWAYYPTGAAQSGDVWINTYYASTQTPSEGNYGFYTLLHEIGHTLGLKHSFTAGLAGDENTTRYTVMAYDSSPFYPTSYMVYDIAAIQKIYGANMTYHTGNDTYTAASVGYTIWDAAGTDTLDASARTSAVTLDLREGEYSSVGLTRNIGIAFGCVIENANGGSGNDVIIGNSGNNVINANNGDDTIVATGGTDTVNGGSGNDILVYDLALSNFAITQVDGTTLQLRDTSLNYGTTTVSNVESFHFANTAYSFATLSALAVAAAESLSNVAINVLTQPSTGQRWTVVDSNLEATISYRGTNFGLSTTANILTVTRSNDTGHDVLSMTATSGYEAQIKHIAINDIDNTDVINFNTVKWLTIGDPASSHDITINTTGALATYLQTGAGADTFSLISSATGNPQIINRVFSGDGNDTIQITALSTKLQAYVEAGSGNDTVSISAPIGTTVYGGTGNDTISGGAGNDLIYGDDGNDILRGNAGVDTFRGGVGDDTFYGGRGSDVLYGGDGADTFVFDFIGSTERDTVVDYAPHLDVIDISDVLTGYGTVDSVISHFVRTTYNATERMTYLQIDSDGAANGTSFLTVAKVEGLLGQSIEGLVSNGHLVIA